MKRAISLVLLVLIIVSVAVFTVSCVDYETPVSVEKNPPKENDGDTDGDLSDIIPPVSGGNDEENTWNEDGNAIGRPVTLPSN